MKYTQKGSRVIVSGRMESSHKDEDGKRITYWNLVVDDIELVKTSLENEQAPKQTQQQDPTPIDDDGLPF